MVTASNGTTGETTTANTNGDGLYAVDLANLTNQWTVGDVITLTATPSGERGTGTHTILADSASATVNITTAALSSATYCSIQNVRDEIDNVSSSDISDARIENNILRAEAEIDLRTKTSWKSNAVADEFYDTNEETMWTSPERGLGISASGRSRNDDGFGYNIDTVKIRQRPILNVTSLSKNNAATTESDSFTTLTEQSGSGGDFIVSTKYGTITFVNDKPFYGKKRAFKVSYNWGLDRTATDNNTLRKMALVRELCVLLSVRQIVTMKGTTSQFSSIDSISLESIAITKNIAQTTTYLRWINEKVEQLYGILGTFAQSMGME